MVDIREIKKLSVDERIEMVEAIWDSIENDTIGAHVSLTKEQEDELERRIKRYESGESKTYTWEEVKQRLEQR